MGTIIGLVVGALVVAMIVWMASSTEGDTMSSTESPSQEVDGPDRTDRPGDDVERSEDRSFSAPASGASSPTTIVVTDPTQGETPPPETVTTATGPDQAADISVARFREIVAEAGLNSDSLTAEDVVMLAEPVCIVAAAETRDGYDRFRLQLASERAADTVLTIDELAIAVDAVVIAFCPNDGQRLGLTT